MELYFGIWWQWKEGNFHLFVDTCLNSHWPRNLTVLFVLVIFSIRRELRRELKREPKRELKRELKKERAQEREREKKKLKRKLKRELKRELRSRLSSKESSWKRAQESSRKKQKAQQRANKGQEVGAMPCRGLSSQYLVNRLSMNYYFQTYPFIQAWKNNHGR